MVPTTRVNRLGGMFMRSPFFPVISWRFGEGGEGLSLLAPLSHQLLPVPKPVPFPLPLEISTRTGHGLGLSGMWPGQSWGQPHACFPALRPEPTRESLKVPTGLKCLRPPVYTTPHPPRSSPAEAAPSHQRRQQASLAQGSAVRGSALLWRFSALISRAEDPG